jgi:hypothetical protein
MKLLQAEWTANKVMHNMIFCNHKNRNMFIVQIALNDLDAASGMSWFKVELLADDFNKTAKQLFDEIKEIYVLKNVVSKKPVFTNWLPEA